MSIKKLALSFYFFLTALNTYAWGPTGHRITGAIAEHYLDAKVRQKLEKLIPEMSLARMSTWADEMRSHPDRHYYGRFSPWHYVTIPSVEKGYDPHQRNPKGDILSALEELEKTAMDPSSSQAKKQEAIKLIVHFVGDLHQPLHVGNGHDRGGNRCWVQFFGKQTNLHRLWDSGLIEFVGLSYSEYSQFLIRQFEAKKLHLNGPMANANYIKMSAESLKERDGVYPPGLGQAGGLGGRSYCQKDKNEINPADVPSLSYQYVFDSRELFEKKLYLAGLRLAKVLNRIFMSEKR